MSVKTKLGQGVNPSMADINSIIVEKKRELWKIHYVVYDVLSHLLRETRNEWRAITAGQILRHTAAPDERGIRMALKDLTEWGYIERERDNTRRSTYRYKLNL